MGIASIDEKIREVCETEWNSGCYATNLFVSDLPFETLGFKYSDQQVIPDANGDLRVADYKNRMRERLKCNELRGLLFHLTQEENQFGMTGFAVKRATDCLRELRRSKERRILDCLWNRNSRYRELGEFPGLCVNLDGNFRFVLTTHFNRFSLRYAMREIQEKWNLLVTDTNEPLVGKTSFTVGTDKRALAYIETKPLTIELLDDESPKFQTDIAATWKISERGFPVVVDLSRLRFGSGDGDRILETIVDMERSLRLNASD